MTTINPTSQTPTPQSASAKVAQQTLGQADFIRLMTTQMKLQDPLEPVDNKEMIAQMAQFSSLAGIADINTTLQAIADKLDHLASLQTPASTTTPPTT